MLSQTVVVASSLAVCDKSSSLAALLLRMDKTVGALYCFLKYILSSETDHYCTHQSYSNRCFIVTQQVLVPLGNSLRIKFNTGTAPRYQLAASFSNLRSASRRRPKTANFTRVHFPHSFWSRSNGSSSEPNSYCLFIGPFFSLGRTSD